MQIYLSQAEYRTLQQLARSQGRSMASVVREALGIYFARGQGSEAWKDDPIMKVIGLAEGDVDDSSSIDEVLYGKIDRQK